MDCRRILGFVISTKYIKFNIPEKILILFKNFLSGPGGAVLMAKKGIDCNRISRQLNTCTFGKKIECFDSIDSTNKYILELARKGAPEGQVVVSDYQSGGKGRLGKEWISPPGKNLLFSVLLKPQAEIEQVQKITLAAANVIAEAVETFLEKNGMNKPDIKLKWPNDLLIRKRKVSGILIESILNGKEITALAAGCGINVNLDSSEFPDSVRSTAVSLKEETKQEISREDFLAHFLNLFEEFYTKWERTDYAGVVDTWKSRCSSIGSQVKIKLYDKEIESYFEDISERGYLLYRTAENDIQELVSGEVVCF